MKKDVTDKITRQSLKKIIKHLDYLSTENFGSLREAHEHRIEDAGWLYVAAKSLRAEVNRLHKNKSNLFTTIEQKLNEKGDEGEAIYEAYPDGHYKLEELTGWCEALEFVLSLMKAQEREK